MLTFLSAVKAGFLHHFNMECINGLFFSFKAVHEVVQ